MFYIESNSHRDTQQKTSCSVHTTQHYLKKKSKKKKKAREMRKAEGWNEQTEHVTKTA